MAEIQRRGHPQTIFVGPLDPGGSEPPIPHARLQSPRPGTAIFPPHAAAIRDAEAPGQPRAKTLFCLIGREGLFCGIQSPVESNGFYPGGTKFIRQNATGHHQPRRCENRRSAPSPATPPTTATGRQPLAGTRRQPRRHDIRIARPRIPRHRRGPRPAGPAAGKRARLETSAGGCGGVSAGGRVAYRCDPLGYERRRPGFDRPSASGSPDSCETAVSWSSR